MSNNNTQLSCSRMRRAVERSTFLCDSQFLNWLFVQAHRAITTLSTTTTRNLGHKLQADESGHLFLPLVDSSQSRRPVSHHLGIVGWKEP